MSEEQKRMAVFTEGVVVGKRRLADRLAFLFQFPDYYVETFCTETNPEFQEYFAFQNPRHLAPYLETIGIDHLLN